ncbi:ATP-binding protein [Anaerosalibacter sp. Marseille-P3206]|uniref:ATP-binding protein n=1 Tax=Anaerosalibacter sp. Marseille-P3206 TaxID=1871005 RepID=UPI0013564D92|nr:ATP-binding protein [Anaerosalibacter sp. Marseille-P3206]
MDKKKKYLFATILIGLSSQLYISYHISNFKFSFAGVLFPVFLYMYIELNPMLLGISSGIVLFIFRILFCLIGGGTFTQSIVAFFPEAIFYIIYGVIFYLLLKLFKTITINKLFFIALGCDLLSNFVEVYIRIGKDFFISDLSILKSLLVVAFIRASLAVLIIIGFKYYRMFLIKAEHEERYKKLLWLTSGLKTEVYWMEKNMDSIEKVMSDAYQLFTKILNEEDRESWGNRALEISRDVHDIKKEYSLVARGIKEILANRTDDSGMYFHELLLILKETMDAEIRRIEKDIVLDFHLGKDFFFKKHYYLMSVFRNMIVNSIESIENKGKIVFIHKMNDKEHIFIIKDNGCGINKEELAHIFSPGYSTKIDYTTGEINRGLGLSLVKNIVEVHLKGDLEVHSEKDKGTTFEITIPIVELEGS